MNYLHDVDFEALTEQSEQRREVITARQRFFKKAPPADGVILVNGADLQPEPISWVWEPWLAKGKLHILAGAPGQGKTTIALALAAIDTSGGCWPDGTQCDEPGNVVIWSGEDDLSDTLLPRLMAAGADVARIFFVKGTRVNGEAYSFDPARDLVALTEQCEHIGDVRLIIVDPIVSAVTGDSHKNTETRRALQPLVDLAACMGAALIGITHFSKGGQGTDPMQRVIGSVAFSAVARVVLVAAKVKGDDGEDRRIFARAKSNIGPDEGGFVYHLEQVEVAPGIQASRIAWGDAVHGTARELLTDPHAEDGARSGALGSATEFLREVLGMDVVPSKSVEAEAQDAGFSWATIRRASDALGVKKSRGTDGKWYWTMPK